MNCKLCGTPAHMAYAVDQSKPDVPLCGPCFGKWSPKKLDGLLGIRQKDYGTEGLLLKERSVSDVSPLSLAGPQGPGLLAAAPEGDRHKEEA